jgi:hypothetical protein
MFYKNYEDEVEHCIIISIGDLRKIRNYLELNSNLDEKSNVKKLKI